MMAHIEGAGRLHSLMRVMVLALKERAALLGCNEQAVYKQVYRQALPYRKLGRKVIFLRQEVEAYLNGLPGLDLRHIN